MSRRRSLNAGLATSVLAIVLLGTAPAAYAEAGGHSSARSGKIAGGKAIKLKRRKAVRIYLPVGPSSIYYDYPYYYARGYYPTHIGGYVYYRSYRADYRKHKRRPATAKHIRRSRQD